jgi:hypothetical protein
MTSEKEYLDLKRKYYEPIVFECLRKDGQECLDAFWTTYHPPLTSNKTICIVERREHPNFDYILKNVCYFCRDWSITIICSNENYAFVKGLLQGKSATVLPLFEGYGTPQQGKEEYNSLLQTETFWKGIDAEWILTVEMDCYLLRPLPKEMFDYDYVASHWAWDKTSQGGGLSLRKKEAMLFLCSQNFPVCPAQDVWANDGCKKYGLKTPTYVAMQNWFVESCFSLNPIGVHQFWTFWNVENIYGIEEFQIHTQQNF